MRGACGAGIVGPGVYSRGMDMSRCYACKSALPRASYVFLMIDGVEVPFCSDEHSREWQRGLPFEVTEVGVAITPQLA